MSTPPTQPGAHVLESGRRFADSLLWKAQRRFFGENGLAAWHAGGVPYHITTNPAIAHAYARVVLSWLQDLERAARAAEPLARRVDLREPVYVIELGAGNGRFAHHFLRSFGAGRPPAPGEAAIRYVMTDFAEKNLEAWRTHPSLAHFVEAGILDFALFDAEHPGPLRLRCSGETLLPGALRNPPVVLANYFFDGIPNDLFSVSSGRLLETRVTLASSQPEPDPLDPGLLARLTMSFEHRPGSPGYDDPDANAVLEEYRERLAEATFLFPCAALRCLRYLGELSAGRLLLLSADKGYDREASLAAQTGPGITLHGSFSVMVNYHAIARYFLRRGGQVLRSSHEYQHLTTIGAVLGLPREATACTRRAFEDMVERFHPDDYHLVKTAFERNCAAFSVGEILAFLRLSGGDAAVLTGSFSVLMERLARASPAARQQLCVAVLDAWARYFPAEDEREVAGCAAALLDRAGYPEEAARIRAVAPRTKAILPMTEGVE